MVCRGLWIGVAWLCLVASTAGQAADEEALLRCEDVGKLVNHYLSRHVSHKDLEGELRLRIAHTYLTRLDPQRSLYVAAEAEAIEAKLELSVLNIRSANCQALHDMHTEVGSRLAAEESFVRNLVGGSDYEVDSTAELVLDPEKRGWPADAAQRSTLLRTLAHFQISNYLNADLELHEARTRLIHRYELRTKRWVEQEPEELYAGFLNAFANGLDPHSGYFSADDLEDFQIGMRLSLEGIGVALSERDGYAVVEEIISGGAADRLDVLRPQDRIIAVAEKDGDFTDVIDMRLRDIVRLIRGKKGTKVRLSVLRQAEKTERFEVSIVRDKVSLEEQAAKLSFEETEIDGKKLKLAIVELPSFYGDRDPRKRQGSRDVAKILNEVRAADADGVLLDLSRNGGGLLEDAVRISGFFIREGGIVGVRGTDEPSRVLDDPDDGILYDGPLVVLTSRVSASASEILAGALKDYRRAVIVGDDHTFGKGTVQSVFPLRPGLGALKVTTALFFRPGGRSTQNDGVGSHVVVPSPFNLDMFGERTQPHALPSQSIAPFLSGRANNNADPRWPEVTLELVEELRARSVARQDESEEFQKLREQLAKRADDDGVIEIAEILQESKDPAAVKTGGGEDGEAAAGATGGDVAQADTPEAKTDEPTPQRREALKVLADLVVLQGRGDSVVQSTGNDAPS
jgi:carboxyl-terminal processing protease